MLVCFWAPLEVCGTNGKQYSIYPLLIVLNRRKVGFWFLNTGAPSRGAPGRARTFRLSPDRNSPGLIPACGPLPVSSPLSPKPSCLTHSVISRKMQKQTFIKIKKHMYCIFPHNCSHVKVRCAVSLITYTVFFNLGLTVCGPLGR